MSQTSSRVPNFKIKFSWIAILQGVEISTFLLIFEWPLQHCSITALPVINHYFFISFLKNKYQNL